LLLRSWMLQMEFSIIHDDSDWLSTNPFPALTRLGNLKGTYQNFQSLLQDTPRILHHQYKRKMWNKLRQGLKTPFSEERSKKRLMDRELGSAFLLLESKVNAWIGQYLIIAPESGKVFFTSFLKENQRVSTAQKLFYLQSTPMDYYGLMRVTHTGLEKIRCGQPVLIQVDGYPSSEFGYLIGTVGSISMTPSGGDSVLIKVELPKGLETNYHKSIYFRNNLSANASIETDHSRLLDRFIGPLKKVVWK
jgi:hypothetical protein